MTPAKKRFAFVCTVQLLLVSCGAAVLYLLQRIVPYEFYRVVVIRRTFICSRNMDWMLYLGHVGAILFLWHIVIPIFQRKEQELADNRLFTRTVQPVTIGTTSTYKCLLVAYVTGWVRLGHAIIVPPSTEAMRSAAKKVMSSPGILELSILQQGLFWGTLISAISFATRKRAGMKLALLDLATFVGVIMLVQLPLAMATGMARLIIWDMPLLFLISLQLVSIWLNIDNKAHNSAP